MNATRKRLLPIDAACELVAGARWSDYESAKAADPGFHGPSVPSYRVYFTGPDLPMTVERRVEEQRRRRTEEAKATLDAWLRECLEHGKCELWARRSDRLAKSEPVPASAVCKLKFDYEERIAFGDGLPPLYDLQIRLPPAASVKRWRKPPPPKELKATALKVAKTYQSDNPPTQAEWWKAMKGPLPEVSRDVAISALRNWAPHLLRKPGQKPNRGS